MQDQKQDNMKINLNSISSPPSPPPRRRQNLAIQPPPSSCSFIMRDPFFHSVPTGHTQPRRGLLAGVPDGAERGWVCYAGESKKKVPPFGSIFTHTSSMFAPPPDRRLSAPAVPTLIEMLCRRIDRPRLLCPCSPFHRPYFTVLWCPPVVPSPTRGHLARKVFGDLPRPWSQMTSRCSLLSWRRKPLLPPTTMSI
jgi:hypothetical protein